MNAFGFRLAWLPQLLSLSLPHSPFSLSFSLLLFCWFFLLQFVQLLIFQLLRQPTNLWQSLLPTSSFFSAAPNSTLVMPAAAAATTSTATAIQQQQHATCNCRVSATNLPSSPSPSQLTRGHVSVSASFLFTFDFDASVTLQTFIHTHTLVHTLSASLLFHTLWRLLLNSRCDAVSAGCVRLRPGERRWRQC